MDHTAVSPRPWGVSVIIPVRPEGSARGALASIERAAHPCPVEVLLAEGTAPCRQRNEAVKQARYALLYFLDDDSQIAAESLRRGIAAFADDSVGAVGGPAETRASAGPVEHAFGEVISTVLGGSITRARNRSLGELRQTHGENLHLSNLMVRHSVFELSGGFAEHLYPGEDPEFLRRLRHLGVRLVYDPAMRVRRARRRTLRSFALQYYRYGRARGGYVLEQPRALDALFFVPALFVLYLLLVAFFPTPVDLLPLALYLLGIAAEITASAVRGSSPVRAALLLPLFPILHISYGAGSLAGVFCWLRGSATSRAAAVTTSRILDLGSGTDEKVGDWASEAGGDECHLQFPGIHALVECAHPDLKRWLCFDFSEFLVEGTPGALPDYRISVAVRPVTAQPVPPLVESGRGPHYVSFDQGEVRYIFYRGAVLSVHNYATNETELIGEDLPSLYEAVSLTLLSRVGEALDRHGLHRVHGFGFELDNVPVLLLAPSGTGKSTLAIALLRAPGTRLYSEDTPLLDRQGRMHRFPFRLGISDVDDAASLPAADCRRATNSFGKTKTLVSAAAFRTQIATEPLSPALVLTAQWTTAPEPTLERISRLTMLRTLVRDCVIGLGIPQLVELFLTHRLDDLCAKGLIAGSRLLAVIRVAASARGYRILLSADRDKNVRLIATLTASTARSAPPQRPRLTIPK